MPRQALPTVLVGAVVLAMSPACSADPAPNVGPELFDDLDRMLELQSI